MKDVTFTIEFVSHCLANGVGPDGEEDHFQRDSSGNIIFQQSWFYSAFSQAIELAHLRDIKSADIHMDLAFRAKTETYRRKYGQSKFRTHEAIMPGTEVTFNAIVTDRVTESAFNKMLERMGRFVGISPYGYRLGYGKFSVVSVQVDDSDAATEKA